MVSLPPTQQSYEAAIPVAIAKYLDRVLFDDENPAETVWSHLETNPPALATSTIDYSGWISVPALVSPIQERSIDRNSVEMEILFRISHEDFDTVRGEAVDRARQLQWALYALSKNAQQITGYSLEGTHRGVFFSQEQNLKLTPNSSDWSITLSPQLYNSCGEKCGAISLLRRTWVCETFNRL